MCSKNSPESIYRTSRRVAPKVKPNPKSSCRKNLKSSKNVKQKLLYVESKRRKQNYHLKSVKSYRGSKMPRSRSRREMSSTRRKILPKL